MFKCDILKIVNRALVEMRNEISVELCTYLPTLKLNQILDSINEFAEHHNKVRDNFNRQIFKHLSEPVNQAQCAIFIPLTNVTRSEPAILSENRLVVVKVITLVIAFYY